jgi:hypothetical protein
MKSVLSLTLIASLMTSPATVAAQASSETGADANWSRVSKLAPETEIIVTVQGSQPVRRYVVLADESNLTVLNLTDPTLPAAVRDVLRQLASHHPEFFVGTSVARSFMERDVRVAPAGVFVAGRKVAELSQVVEQVRRQDVTAIGTAKVERNAVGCAVAGYYGGAIVGGLPGAVIGGAVGRDTGPALLGMTLGWSAGAVLVYRKCRHTPEKVIYRAP